MIVLKAVPMHIAFSDEMACENLLTGSHCYSTGLTSLREGSLKVLSAALQDEGALVILTQTRWCKVEVNSKPSHNECAPTC